ncbi:MAG: aminotransferase class III-fold pyridoxal phosphate-dependent enzyme [Rhizobiaceae bacterium]
MRRNDLIELDREHLVHPVSSWADHEAAGATVFESGRGLYLRDSEGVEHLDAFAGLWCVNVGYGQDSVAEAMAEQARRLPYMTGYFGHSNEPAIRLAAKLAELTPGDLNHIYFCLSGSDAVDGAVRLATYYWRMKGEPQRRHMIAQRYGYHGASSTGSGLTALAAFHRGFDMPLPTQHHIDAPYAYRHRTGRAQDIIADCVASLRGKVAELGADTVAAFFCEPVIGSGGVIVPPKGWLKAMEETCRELGILFVVDEVITGFGRTGAMFACEHEDVRPDMMTMAKGLTSGYSPMGALAISDRIYASIRDLTPAGTAIGHGTTYSAHPVSAAAGVEVIRLYEEGGILANAKAVGPYFAERLASLGDHPLVGDVRCIGLLAAIEIVADKRTREKFPAARRVGRMVAAAARENRIMIRAFDDGIVGLAPALVITRDEVDMLVSRLRNMLDLVQSRMGEHDEAE